MKNRMLALLFLFPILLQAQHSISGQVQSPHESCAYANVVLTDSLEQFVGGAVTDQNGHFEFKAPTGVYQLQITHLNYQSMQLKNMFITTDTVLQTIVLKEQATALSEVTVTSKRLNIRREIDKTVVNIESSAMAQSSNLFDALKSAPGLVISNDLIVMLGKSTIRVSIDGRMIELSGSELSDFLKTISASDVKAIEIMTNPSAKYEAEGNSGIVNIVMKAVKRNSWNNRFGITHYQASLGRQALTNTFSYQKNKLSLLLTTNYNRGQDYIRQIVTPNYSQNPQEIESKQTQNFNSLSPRLLLDYKLNESTTIGAQYMGAYNRLRQLDDLKITVFKPDYSINSFLLADDTQFDRDRNHSSYNFYFDKQLDSLGKSITLNIDALDYRGTVRTDILSKSYDADLNFMELDFANRGAAQYQVANYSAKLDMEQPMSWVHLSYGAKANFSQTDYQLDNFNTNTGEAVFNPLQSNTFAFQENIQSVYVNGRKQLAEKWETQFGLRAELTQTTGFANKTEKTPIFENDYAQLFPTFYLKYNKSEAHVFSFNYGRRINRPAYAQLNPARSFLSSQSAQQGNPFLRPSFSDNIELTHMFKRNLTTTLSLSHISDAYSFIFELNDATEEQLITYKNLFKENRLALFINYQLDLTSWWSARPFLYYGYSHSKKQNSADNIRLMNSSRAYASIQNQLSFNEAKTVTGELNFWYDSPYSANLYRFGQAYALDCSISFKSLLKGMTITLSGHDLLNSSPRSITSFSNNIQHDFLALPSNRHFRLTIAYRFGNENIQTNARQFGNETIRQRSN